MEMKSYSVNSAGERFLIIDILFFSANLIKVHNGRWVSIGIAAVICIIMWTWKGSHYLFNKIYRHEVPFDCIIRNQDNLTGTLLRLMALVKNYLDLKAN